MSGLPLLSGPPPSGPESEACRKCGKEFNILFSRSRKCNHCGFHYCHSCSDYQALMPRRGPENGYVATNVCGYCIEHLNITAGGKNQLKSLPIGRLRKYANAYDIRIDRAVEKDDIIDAIVAARGPNGCLPPPKEDYYRRHSVPVTEPRSGLRNLFRGSPPPAPPSPPPPPPHRRPTFARPDLEPDPPRNNDRPPPPPPRPSQPQYQYAPPPGPPPPPTQYQGHYGTPYTYSSPQPHPSPNQYPPPQSYYEGPYGPPPNPPPRPHPSWENTSHQGGYPPFNGPPGYGYQQGGYVPQSYGTSPPPPPPPPPQSTRPAPQTAPPPPPPRPQPQQQSSSRPQPTSRSSAPPTLDVLLEMSSDDIASLSISALKQILFTNHVNAGQVLEKGELVKKVVTLVEDEKRERERQRRVLEMEEMERLQMERERLEEQERERERRRERERVAEEQERRARETEAGERRARERETEERRNRGTGGSGAGSQTRIHIVNLGPVSEDGMSEYGGEDEDRSPFTEHATSRPSPAQPRAEPFSQRSTTPKPPPQPSFKPSTMDRTGLCVVCQDEEANIAIIDCGHLAMCRGCSDLVMSSSRECPLCRTRIVTEARLLRIFKT